MKTQSLTWPEYTCQNKSLMAKQKEWSPATTDHGLDSTPPLPQRRLPRAPNGKQAHTREEAGQATHSSTSQNSLQVRPLRVLCVHGPNPGLQHQEHTRAATSGLGLQLHKVEDFLGGWSMDWRQGCHDPLRIPIRAPEPWSSHLPYAERLQGLPIGQVEEM